jgi:actin-like ATPase involved in cell morphogenesis/Tfp pilus assembly protein PilZ
MTSHENTRQHKRYPVSWIVEIRASEWRDALLLATSNVSKGGLFVRSAQPPALGTHLSIVLNLPDDMILRVEGVVVHSIPPERAEIEGVAPGFGVRFDAKHAVDLSLVEGLAATHTEGGYAYSIDESYVALPAVLVGGELGETESTTAYQLVEEPPAAVTSAPSDAAETGILAVPEPESLMVFAPDRDSALFPAVSPAKPQAVVAAPEHVFGIDFGTTYTSVALVQGNQVHVCVDAEGLSMIPSVVSYPEAGPPVVGWAAREQMATSPSTTFVSPKRLVGRSYRDPKLQVLIGSSPVHLHEGPGGLVVAEVYGNTIALGQICAEIFRHAATLARADTGIAVEHVVLSTPVAFGPERVAVKRAAEIAGLTVIGMVDEPVAAAMAFGLGLAPGQTVAVYDFGGGTFDFTLLRVRPRGGFEILGEAGDPWLGGDDFDFEIAAYAANRFWREHKIDLRERQVEWQRLLFLCEQAKRKLSTEQEFVLHAREIALSVRGPIDLELPLNRELLQRLCGELIDRSVETMASCMELAGARPESVDHVVLTGGVSRNPLVRERVQEFFRRDITLSIDPELAVVAGGAIFGRFMALQQSKKSAPAPG